MLDVLPRIVKISTAVAASAIYLAGCAAPPIKIPMDQIEYLANPAKRSANLLILMAGAGDRHDAFEKYGYISEARQAGLNADIIAADAHYDFFTELTVRERLHEEIVKPAKAKGYQSIWMGGISLGGFGSLIYSQKYAEELAGLVLIAPYIGNRGTLAEIEKAGGLVAWNPGDVPDHDERGLWVMLKKYQPNTKPALPIHLMYGNTDRFNAFHDMLASRLDKRYVKVVDGGHDWPQWQALWREFVASNPFANGGVGHSVKVG
jgi:pimeloyl-ACP methyl ester carboxylesterase